MKLRKTRVFFRTVGSTIVHDYLGVKPSLKNRDLIEEFREADPKKYKIAKVMAYGVLGIIIGSGLGRGFANFGFYGGIGTALLVGTVPLITSKLLGEKEKDKGKLGMFISLDVITGEVVFPTTIGTVYLLSEKVDGVVNGGLIGAAAILPAVLIPIITFYLPLFILNNRKYRNTGFGNVGELANVPSFYIRTLSNPLFLY